MPLIQVRLVEGSLAMSRKQEIVRKLAHAIRARQRASASPPASSSKGPVGLDVESAAMNTGARRG